MSAEAVEDEDDGLQMLAKSSNEPETPEEVETELRV